MERDYPVGHPAAGDYKGEPYRPPSDDLLLDYPPSHPAHHGKNVSDVDTPDGMRAVQMRSVQSLTDLASQGALPPLFAPGRKEPLPLTPPQLAHLYATRKQATLSGELTADEQQVLGYITGLGYGPGDALKMFIDYAQPPKADASVTT